MKRFFWVLLLISICWTFNSCINDDNDIITRVVNATKIDSVSMPEIETLGTTAEIKMYYTRTNSCEFYEGIVYQTNLEERTVTMYTALPESATNCTDINQVTSRTLNFLPNSEGIYTFNFWQGLDSEDQNVYLTKEIKIIAE